LSTTDGCSTNPRKHFAGTKLSGQQLRPCPQKCARAGIQLSERGERVPWASSGGSGGHFLFFFGGVDLRPTTVPIPGNSTRPSISNRTRFWVSQGRRRHAEREERDKIRPAWRGWHQIPSKRPQKEGESRAMQPTTFMPSIPNVRPSRYPPVSTQRTRCNARSSACLLCRPELPQCVTVCGRRW